MYIALFLVYTTHPTRDITQANENKDKRATLIS